MSPVRQKRTREAGKKRRGAGDSSLMAYFSASGLGNSWLESPKESFLMHSLPPTLSHRSRRLCNTPLLCFPLP